MDDGKPRLRDGMARFWITSASRFPYCSKRLNNVSTRCVENGLCFSKACLHEWAIPEDIRGRGGTFTCHFYKCLYGTTCDAKRVGNNRDEGRRHERPRPI